MLIKMTVPKLLRRTTWRQSAGTWKQATGVYQPSDAQAKRRLHPSSVHKW